MKKFQSEKGFTLIESLLSLLVFMIIISVTTSSLKGFLSRNHSNGSLNRLEWENFIYEVQEEANLSLSQKIYSEMVIFEDQNHVPSSYHQYANIIRRQKLGTGHEIVLQNVGSIEFKRKSNRHILVKVVDLNGREFEKTIRLFIDSF